MKLPNRNQIINWFSPKKVKTVFPIIVPRSYFDFGNFPGNYLLLKHPELAVTWVEFDEPGAMLYVSKPRQKELEEKHGDLHQHAMKVLRQHSEKQLVTHLKEIDGRNQFAGMMHEDGLGSSRLLLLPELKKLFPAGFQLGIPDRSCGMVMSNGLSTKATATYTELVNDCFKKATTPMLGGFQSPTAFELSS